MKQKRFERYLLDGGFTFGDEYIPPVWAICDRVKSDSVFTFLQFTDEEKDLCDLIVGGLNDLAEEKI